jgi:hypothetical protein
MLTMCLLGAVCAAAFAAVAPGLAGRLPPRTAICLLVGGALATTGAVLGMMALLAVTVLARVPLVASLGDWSLGRLRSGAPVPAWAAVSCLVLLVPAGAAGLATGYRHATAMLRLRRACRDLRSPETLVVLDSDRPDAFATPVDGGHVVVTTGMLRALHTDEVRALLEHERSHLRNRHAWWMLAAQVCGAVNPMLSGVVRAAGHAVERCADEDAARTVGDRRLVARTLARAALHVHDTVGAVSLGAPGTVGAMNGTVLVRVESLLREPPRRHVVATVTLLALALSTVTWAAAVRERADDFFDGAHTPAAVSHLGPGIR